MMKIVRANEVAVETLLTPPIQSGNDLESAVDKIIQAVQKGGDKALIDFTRRFDGVTLDSIKVTQSEIDAAWAGESEDFKSILQGAAENIRAFHLHQKRDGFMIDREGIVMGQKLIPLKRVGLYVPGGTASYPSSVLMNAVPPVIAGVKELIMVTPPQKDGTIAPSILCAAKVAGVHTIFKLGGAQAIAALAYGTQSVPRVDKIVGPGNAYVATAKRRVYGLVDIDMVAGPSEVLIISDANSDAKNVAADLLSQAEHDKLASAILLTDDEDFAKRVQQAVEIQLSQLPREEIARTSIENNGKIILVDSITQAIELANRIAPEHLELCVDDPFALLGFIENAGSVFLGRNTPEALGDYWAGPNHTLPTSGTARFSSPLSVDDFVKKTQFLYYTYDALSDAYRNVSAFARREGLTAHARSVEIRFEEA